MTMGQLLPIDDRRYCDRCGAQISGPGSWGHDDNCPKKHRAAKSLAERITRVDNG